MGKCLVTKLQGVVNNTTLPKLGELFMTVKAGDTPHSIRVNHQSGHQGGIARIVSGTGYFTDEPGTLNVQQIELNSAASTKLIVATTTDVVIAIPNKYYLTYLGHNDFSVITSRELNKTLIVDAEEMKYANLENVNNLYFTIDGEFNVEDINHSANIIGIHQSPTFANLNGDGLYGDATPFLASLSGSYGGSLREFFVSNKMYADISVLTANVGQLMRFEDDRNNSVFQWKGTRSSDKTIIAFPFNGFNFGNDLDAMLINQANCVAGAGTGNDKAIHVWGNRTSASDSAVATLKTKGYSVKVNNVEL